MAHFEEIVSHIEQIPSRLRITAETALLLLVVALPFSVQAGFFSGLFADEFVVETVSASGTTSNDATEITLLSAEQNPNPSNGRGGAEIVIDENALVSTGPISEDQIAAVSSNGEIRVYTVREGDSLSQIADMFDVTANTIMWANDIARPTDIQPGDSLVILPIVGVRHVVKSGDTISTIAKKYEGNEEEILSYNQLSSGSEIAVGNTIIVPGGAMHTPSATRATTGGRATTAAEGGSNSGLTHPAPGTIRSQGIHGFNAVDLAGAAGSPIRAAAGGEVIVAKASGWNGGYGNYVVIKHANGTQTLYAHLSTVGVGVGSYVSQGEVIGGMGSTGKSTGNHLHFEVRGGRNPF